MSADTYDCELCGVLVFRDHRAHHEANQCPVLQRRKKKAANKRKGRARKATEPPRRGRPAKCALAECGATFVSRGVTHRHCCPKHADLARQGDAEETGADRLVREMAPLAREQDLMRRTAAAVPLLSGETSYTLWFRLLGIDMTLHAGGNT